MPHDQIANSASYVDVTLADGARVLQPLVASENYDPNVARENSRRIHAILTSPQVGEYCTIYFPPGDFYFAGAHEDWQASIQTTHPHQTIRGAGENATRIRQADVAVSSTLRVHHSGCVVQDLNISSADHDAAFHPGWDQSPHQAAIHLDAPSDTWYLDPQVRNVKVNTTGNNIIPGDYYRPFRVGIKVTGAWLNVYVHTMWLREVFNAIYINQGPLIAGPAKFIDVNAYATPPDVSKTWNVFFKSEGHFMEQVELIHCTYIGSQFIYMDGTRKVPGANPAYNMVIDHNYINNCWLPAGDGPEFSGIYLNLPPLENGDNFTRDIRFTNNSCTAKSPRRGAFFYAEGNCRGITLEGNDIQSGGDDKCVYIRSTQPIEKSQSSIKDIKIANNYFRNFRNPITIGGDLQDPARRNLSSDYGGGRPDRLRGEDEDPHWIDRVIISGNQTYNLPAVDKNMLATCFIHKARKLLITGNAFTGTDNVAIAVDSSEEVAIADNTLSGMAADNSRHGILLTGSDMATVSGNTLRHFNSALETSGSNRLGITGNVISDSNSAITIGTVGLATLGNNTIDQCKQGMLVRDSRDIVINGNAFKDSQSPLALTSVNRAVITGNMLRECGSVDFGGDCRDLIVRINAGIDDLP